MIIMKKKASCSSLDKEDMSSLGINTTGIISIDEEVLQSQANISDEKLDKLYNDVMRIFQFVNLEVSAAAGTPSPFAPLCSLALL